MKVVINRCYGGFGLSPRAIKDYLKLKGKKCYFFRPVWDGRKRIYTPITIQGATKSGYFDTFDIKNPNLLKGNKQINKHYIYLSGSIDRSDPDLIKVVEKLGPKKASGSFSSLDIREIPDGINYEIQDYDGMESIHEIHRSW